MSYENVSYTLNKADLDAVKAAIATINSKLPFLITSMGKSEENW